MKLGVAAHTSSYISKELKQSGNDARIQALRLGADALRKADGGSHVYALHYHAMRHFRLVSTPSTGPIPMKHSSVPRSRAPAILRCDASSPRPVPKS